MSGIAFPLDSKGQRSTTVAGKNVWSAAIQALDPELAESIQEEKDWRHKYPPYLMKLATTAVLKPENAISIARSGLEQIHSTFEFVREGKSMPLADAFKTLTPPIFKTGTIAGSGEQSSAGPAISHLGKKLEGKELLQELKDWADYGSIEPDVVETVARLQENPKWLDLSKRWFVLFGAGSAMGPLSELLHRGANVIAIGTRRSDRWKQLITLARGTSGTLYFPLSVDQTADMTDEELCGAAGCDLLAETPEICTWIRSFAKKPLTVGMYTYIDGEAHCRASLAVDAITLQLMDSLGKEDISLAFLGSPAVACVVPEAASMAMKDNYLNSSWWHGPLSCVLGGFKPSSRPPVIAADGGKFYLNDGFAVLQGPNYALAKTMQMWRAVLAREEGMSVCSAMAPPSRTESVMHNSQVATAMDGLHHFKPLVGFQSETAATLMALILMHDLQNPNSAASPDFPLRNPMEMFVANAVHGGTWRCGYRFDSIGKALYLCGKLSPEQKTAKGQAKPRVCG